MSVLPRLAFFAVVVGLAGLMPRSHGPLASAYAGLVLCAVAIAVWHGAFDGVVARPILRPLFGRRWWPVFGISYLFLAFLVLLCWWLLPAAMLIAFLLYSSWHFGTEGFGNTELTAGKALSACCLGAVPIVAACYWHPEAVTPIFSMMVRSNTNLAPARITEAAGILFWPVLAAVLLSSAITPLRRRDLLVLTALELFLFWRCSPVVAFAVFFCAWHTPEHLVASSEGPRGRVSFRRMRLQLRSGLFPWLSSLAGLSLLFILGNRTMSAYSAELFVFLSALTVPHMAFNELKRRKTSRSRIWSKRNNPPAEGIRVTV